MKNKILLAVYIASSIIVVLSLILFLSRDEFKKTKDEEKSGETEISVSGQDTEQETEAETEYKEPYVSQIDFEELAEINTDVYAWLAVLNTDISYPVVQSPTDDNYYLKHLIDGTYSDLGSLYTEHEYNTTSFEDRVTIIYGHQFPTGGMFSFLQRDYNEEGAYDNLSEVYVFLPDKELHYTVFAAVPYTKWHILDRYYNFPNDSMVEFFLEKIAEIEDSRASFNPDCVIGKDVTGKDKILILETCLYNDDNGRFLVLCKLDEVVD